MGRRRATADFTLSVIVSDEIRHAAVDLGASPRSITISLCADTISSLIVLPTSGPCFKESFAGVIGCLFAPCNELLCLRQPFCNFEVLNNFTIRYEAVELSLVGI